MINLKKVLITALMPIILISCASKEKIIYFQNLQNGSSQYASFEPRLQSDDLLMILVTSKSPEAVKDFNLPTVSVMGTTGSLGGVSISSPQQVQTYLIDFEGNIHFPVIGKIRLVGLTKSEALNLLSEKIKEYVTDAVVTMRIMNFKISVIGEVVRPGSFNILTERVTLPEALSMAGDMTIYGNRNRVLVMREVNGIKNHVYVDMTKTDFINSPYYYLTQNDMIYVEPNKTKVNSSVIGPNITVAISGISLLITIIALATR